MIPDRNAMRRFEIRTNNKQQEPTKTHVPKSGVSSLVAEMEVPCLTNEWILLGLNANVAGVAIKEMMDVAIDSFILFCCCWLLAL